MSNLTLTFKGYDDWDRPVYESEGRLFVDADPRSDHGPDLCTKSNNDFYGEPDMPIRTDIEVTFVPNRITW